MKRSAQAKWQGDLKSGAGTISTASGTLATTPYSFRSRFEQGTGTNPEELLAAAHAGCFTMALSAQLAEAGLKATSLETSCTITLEPERGRLRHHRKPPGVESQSSRCDGRGFREGDEGRGDRVPGIETLQYQDHARCASGVLMRVRGAKGRMS